MKKIEFNVQEPYKTYLLEGKKKVEGRLNKGKFGSLELGDILMFESGEMFEVTGKRIYKTFLDMIKNEGREKVIPDSNNDKEAEDVYFKFYTKNDEEEFGVIAIELNLIK